jgi:hypothetical protein
VAEQSTGDCRASSFGLADIFQQCQGSGLVEPNMPKIPTGLLLGSTWRTAFSAKTERMRQSKEQKGGYAAPAIIMMAACGTPNFRGSSE